jgi:dipeptidyl aminopeptidase/acylaminoacyl peptidase
MNSNRTLAKLGIALLALILAGCGWPSSQVASTPAAIAQPTAAPPATPTTSTSAGASQPTAPRPATPPATFTPATTTDRDAPLSATVSNGGNVRSAPSTNGTVVLDQINAGETVLLRMSTPDGQWFSIVDPRGVIGWSWVGLLSVDPAVAARLPIGNQDDGVMVVPTAPPASTPQAHDDSPEMVTWQGLQFPLPGGYRYETELPSNAFDFGGAPIQASLTLIPSDVPERSYWRTVAFNGSVEDFLATVRNSGTEEPWLDEASIRRVTVAGLPAIVYNRYQAPRYQDYIVGLRSDLLLLIDSDATRPEQTAAIDQLTVVGQPSDPRPRAQQIAYIHDPDRSIWLFDMATNQSRQIVAGPVGGLAWSPDGVWLAFSAGLESSHIYMMRLDGSSEDQITSGEDYESHPAFSPSGELYYIRQDSSDPRKGFQIVKRTKADTEEIVYAESEFTCDPHDLRAASDNRFAVVVSCGSGNQTDVMIFDRASGTVEYVLGKYLLGGQCAYGADWAPGLPNGLGLLISSDCRPQKHSTIYLADVSSAEPPREPTVLGKAIASLDFSPDGRAIVFDTTTPDDQSSGLWVVTIGDQSAPRKIVDEGIRPVWRP